MSCALASGSGPFASFEIDKAKLSFKYSDAIEKGSVSSPVSLQSSKMGKPYTETLRYFYVVSDWASGNIFIDSDDEGTAAFVTFRSDGPAVTGYYRCK